MSCVSFLKSLKGKRVSVYMDNIYRLDKANGDITYWRCICYPKCKARLVLKKEAFYKTSGPIHNHESNSKAVLARQFKEEVIKEIKKAPTQPVPQIYKEVLSKRALTMGDVTALPSFNSAKTTFYHARPRLKNAEDSPKTDKYKTNKKRRREILSDTDGILELQEKIEASDISVSDNLETSARSSPFYSKSEPGNFLRNAYPWKTLEDSYVALTASNRELLIKLFNQSLKKRKDFVEELNKFKFQWTDFDIDGNQPSSLGDKVVYHATMPQYSQYSFTLVIFIQQQTVLQENIDIKYPMYGKFSDDLPRRYLDTQEENDFQANECLLATILVLDRSNILTVECFSQSLSEPLTEENEKEVCFITLQLIQSLKSLQVQGIEWIDTSCENLLLAKTKQDKYHNLIFLYEVENDYSEMITQVSLCQYTLMLLFQMLKIQAIDDPAIASKFSSSMSKKVFETAFSFLREKKAVSLSQTKTLFECYLWGVTKVLESIKDSDDYDGILHRWLDIERSNCIKCIVSENSNYINIQNEFYSQFLIHTNVRNIREVAAFL